MTDFAAQNGLPSAPPLPEANTAPVNVSAVSAPSNPQVIEGMSPSGTTPSATQPLTLETNTFSSPTGAAVAPTGVASLAQPELSISTAPSIAPAPVMPDTPAEPSVSSLPQPTSSGVSDLAAGAGLPDVSQMQELLMQSGALLGDLNVKEIQKKDTSPLAALQPDRIRQTGEPTISPITAPSMEPHLNSIALANAGYGKVTQDGFQFPFFLLAAAVLFLQAVQGVFQLIHFILVKFPLFEHMLVMNQLLPNQINIYTVKAIILAGLVLLSTVIGSRILMRHQSISLPFWIIGISLIALNAFWQNMMTQPEFASGNPLQLPKIIQEIQAAKTSSASWNSIPMEEVSSPAPESTQY
jgi:hypothetical protein